MRLAQLPLDRDPLLELLITYGWHRLPAAVINAVGIEPEPWAARFARSAGMTLPSVIDDP